MRPRLAVQPAPVAPIVCCVCGSMEWIRCAPGEASDAERYGETNVLPLFPYPGVPAVAWCRECDPMLVRG